MIGFFKFATLVLAFVSLIYLWQLFDLPEAKEDVAMMVFFAFAAGSCAHTASELAKRKPK